MQPSDAALIGACRRGDAAAWEMLVGRYQRLVYSVPRRAGLDEDAAAEVFQSVFAALVEHLDAIEQPDRIGAWLMTTARREAWRVGRRLAGTRTTATVGQGDDGMAVDIPDTDPLPDEAAIQLEEQHTVRQAVAALDDRCRTLLTLLFYRAEPPPYAEIAAALGTSQGSIGPTRARCLEKLRHLLVERGFEAAPDAGRTRRAGPAP